MRPDQISQPWRAFLSEIDSCIKGNLELHCLGGFAVTMFYGLERPTADVDVAVIAPATQTAELLRKAGKNSELHRRLGIYLDLVQVATIPEDYDRRLVEMFPGRSNDSASSLSILMTLRSRNSNATFSATGMM